MAPAREQGKIRRAEAQSYQEQTGTATSYTVDLRRGTLAQETPHSFSNETTATDEMPTVANRHAIYWL